MNELLKQQTRLEWRRLGFFYDRIDSSKEWLLVGSRVGLLRFAALLKAYVSDPRNVTKSEHEHYGPYMYLEVMTWSETGIDEHSIHGPLNELGRLAGLVEAHAVNLRPGSRVHIRDEFAPMAKYSLSLEIREDDFDPASLDPNLVEGPA